MALRFKQDSNGIWQPYRAEEQGIVPVSAIDYDSLTDEELAEIATGKGIDIEGMTRKKVVAALKKAV